MQRSSKKDGGGKGETVVSGNADMKKMAAPKEAKKADTHTHTQRKSA